MKTRLFIISVLFAVIPLISGWHQRALPIPIMVTNTNGSGPASLAGGIALEAYANNGARFENIQVTSLKAQPDPWVQTNGPSGGVINTVELHPTNPDTVFIGGFGGVFKSTNGGAKWTPLPQFLPANTQVNNLLINPNLPEVMYAFAGPLYKTSNGGDTWTPLFGEQPITCVAMDPASPNHLLVGGTDGAVWYSDNGGRNWNNVSNNLPAYPIKSVGFGKVNELWVGTGISGDVGNGLLYHSTNNGASWSAVNNLGQAASSEIHTIFVDPQDPDLVYVGLRNIYNEMFGHFQDVYLVKTTNDGASWAALHLPFTDAMVNVMGRASYDTGLYVGTGSRAFRSDDGGQAWAEITPGLNGDMYDVAVDPRNRDVLYLPRRGYGVVKSADRGASWMPINDGLRNTTVSLIALGDPSGSTIYASSAKGEGTYKSTDYGDTWVNVTAGGITHPWADELAVRPTDPQTIWEVADVGQFFVSHDGGSTWKMTINPRGNGDGFRAGTVSAAAIASSDSTVVYALKSGFGIFKSPNGGLGWDFLHQSEVDYTYSLAVHPTNPDVVFSGYSSKPFQDWAMARRSTDGGITWSTVLSVTHSSGITSVAIDPQKPNIVYAGSTGRSAGGGGQIYHSTNGGDTWTPLNRHFTMLTVWGQPQLTGDPTNPATAYAATWLGGTWKTTNAGQTWTLLDKAPRSSTALSLDPANPGVVYAADRTSPQVWKSTDSGATWTAVANFSSTGAFMLNRVLVAGHAVYAATFGPGIHDGKLYRSADGGSSWNDITNGLPRSVLDVSVDPANPQVIFVTTHIHGAYKSIDGGATWSALTNFPDIGGYDIEVDPVSPNIVYAAGLGDMTVPDWVLPGGYTFTDHAGVYKSTDGGQTWVNILTTHNECRAIRIHPENHNLLLVSALSDGFFVSTDGGNKWANIVTGLDSRNLTSVWTAGNKVYAGTQGFGVYSGDVDRNTGAVTWVAARSNKPVPDVFNVQIQVDPTNSSRVYVSANPGGLFRSDDGGSTWYDKNFLTPSVVVDDPKRQGYYTFAMNPANSNEVWVGTWGKGIYKSYDGQDFNIGANGSDHIMFGKNVNALMFHPALGILAATEQGVFHTTDGGKTWTDWSTGLGTSQVRTLSVYADGTVLCGTAGYELYVRRPSDPQWRQLPGFDNFGTFWPIWNNRPLYQYSQLLFHPTDPSTIYFGTFPAGVFKSLDDGMTWREYNVGWLNDGVFTLVFQPQNSNIVYAGTYNGLNRSLDAGAHWERLDTGWPSEQWVFSIAFDPRNPNVMYACSKNGGNEGTGRPGFHGTVMKSTDGGVHWFAITTGLDVDQEFYKIIVDKFHPDTVYVATQSSGVYISVDGGMHWGSWNDGLTNPAAGTNGNNVTNTMALSADGMYLYFGSAGSGVFRRMTSP